MGCLAQHHQARGAHSGGLTRPPSMLRGLRKGLSTLLLKKKISKILSESVFYPFLESLLSPTGISSSRGPEKASESLCPLLGERECGQ